MPSPSHILAGPGDIAEIAVTYGDPARVEQLSRMLKDAKLVNSNRGFMTYTGYYGKTRITLATTKSPTRISFRRPPAVPNTSAAAHCPRCPTSS